MFQLLLYPFIAFPVRVLWSCRSTRDGVSSK